MYVLSEEPMYLSRADDHRKVWEWYAGRPGTAGQVNTLGQGLRTKRNAADYDKLTNYKAEAEAAVKKARQVIKLLAAMVAAS
jgi:hypothetical protein